LHFPTGALINYLGLLLLLFFINWRKNKYLNNKPLKEIKNTKIAEVKENNLFPSINNKTFCILSVLLILIIVFASLTYFTLEGYSSSSRYFFIAATPDENKNPLGVFISFLGDTGNSWATFIQSITYLVTLLVGGFFIFNLLVNNLKFNKLINSYPITGFFSITTLMSLVITALVGILQGGLYFWGKAPIRYFDISSVFAYIGFSALLIEKIALLRKYSFIIALTIVTLGFCYAVYDFNQQVVKKPLKLPLYSTYSCIKHYETQYHLQDGIGSYWVSLLLNTYGSNKSRLNMHSFAYNPPMIDPFWLNSVYQPVNTINYLVYIKNDKDDYSQNALAMLNLLVPNSKITQLSCKDGNDVISINVLDDNSAKVLTQVIRQNAANGRSFSSVTSYGFGQNLWKHTPWNQQYITKNHSFVYYGIMLQKTSSQIIYTNNDDLSITLSNLPAGKLPILSSGYLRAGNGKYSIKLAYSSNESLLLAAVDIQKGSIIASWELSATNKAVTNSDLKEFTLDTNTSIALMLISNNNVSPITVKFLDISWNGFN
jgi:hypothetical protein